MCLGVFWIVVNFNFFGILTWPSVFINFLMLNNFKVALFVLGGGLTIYKMMPLCSLSYKLRISRFSARLKFQDSLAIFAFYVNNLVVYQVKLLNPFQYSRSSIQGYFVHQDMFQLTQNENTKGEQQIYFWGGWSFDIHQIVIHLTNLEPDPNRIDL